MNGLVIAVDPDLDTAPYQQIVDQFLGLIERGDLKPGDLLPTVRQLAGDLGVAPNTVARAYGELQERGCLAGEGRRGTHVADVVPASDKRSRSRALREAVDRFAAALTHRGFSLDEITNALARFAEK